MPMACVAVQEVLFEDDAARNVALEHHYSAEFPNKFRILTRSGDLPWRR